MVEKSGLKGPGLKLGVPSTLFKVKHHFMMLLYLIHQPQIILKKEDVHGLSGTYQEIQYLLKATEMILKTMN